MYSFIRTVVSPVCLEARQRLGEDKTERSLYLGARNVEDIRSPRFIMFLPVTEKWNC